MTVLSLTGKPRGWLTKQVLMTADSVETVAELVDVWCRKGVSKKRLMEILRKNKHVLCGEWEANTRDGYAEVWTHCPDCGLLIHVAESQWTDDGWLDLRRRLAQHYMLLHQEKPHKPALEWWDTYGTWEWSEAPNIMAKVEAVRAEAKQGSQEQAEEERSEVVVEDEDERWRGVRLALLRMWGHPGAAFVGSGTHAPAPAGEVEGER